MDDYLKHALLILAWPTLWLMVIGLISHMLVDSARRGPEANARCGVRARGCQPPISPSTTSKYDSAEGKRPEQQRQSFEP